MKRWSMNRKKAKIDIKTEIPGPNSQKWVDAYMKHAAPSTYAYPFVWDVTGWAEGPFCTDPDGNVFMDFYGHVGAAPLGYNHPRILADCGVPFDPIKTAEHDTFLSVGRDPRGPRQLPLRGNRARDFRTATDLQEMLVKLTARFRMDTVFLVNSGGEAVSNAVKISLHRKFMEVKARIGEELFAEMCHQLGIRKSDLFSGVYADYPLFGLAARGAFHGRTLDVLTLTNSKKVHKEGFPTIRWVRHVDVVDSVLNPEDIVCETDLKTLILNKRLSRVVYEEGRIPGGLLAYVIVEPIQGEGGYRVPRTENVKALLELAHRHHALFISDEVQAGIGRSGRWWAIEHHGVAPDVIAAAKGLRVGAVISRANNFPAEPGVISSTWTGGDIAIAVGYKTLQIIEEEGLVHHAADAGQYLMGKLRSLKERHPLIEDVRGHGLMVGIELSDSDSRDRVVNGCFERGLLLLGCGDRTVRMLPPLDVRPGEMDMAVAVFEQALKGGPCSKSF
jgi:4-aminobutyrate aminotransferase